MQTKREIQEMFADMGLGTPKERSCFLFSFAGPQIQSHDPNEVRMLNNRTDEQEDGENVKLG
jgi:hypothetical protein